MGFFVLSGAGVTGMPMRADAPTALLSPGYLVTLTAYNAVPEQTDSDPDVTASGVFSNPEVVAARSRDLAKELPFGTVIAIDGPIGETKTCGFDIVKPSIGYRIIADTMNARYTDRIDVLFDTKDNYLMADGSTKNAGRILGICNKVEIRVVGYVDISRPSKLPKTQAELAMLVSGAGAFALK